MTFQNSRIIHPTNYFEMSSMFIHQYTSTKYLCRLVDPLDVQHWDLVK